MPTYEYECRKCGHTFEKFQSMTEERVKTCPKCRGRVDRLFGSGAGIIFKGSGFYQTDYRSDSYQKAAQTASTATAAPAPEAKPGTAAASDATSKPDTKKSTTDKGKSASA